MKYNNILKKYKLNKSKLISYGFTKENNNYLYTIDLNQSLYAKIIINDETLEVNVYDKSDDSIYLPFNVKNSTGTYVAKVKEQIEDIINDITDKCFTSNNIKEKVFKYIKEKYDIFPAYLWEKDDITGVFRNEKEKWFAIYMEIPIKKLTNEGEDIVGVINVKNKPEKIENIIDNKSYFSAYHMNKKHWFTILLDNNSNLTEIKKYIDESYNLINK